MGKWFAKFRTGKFRPGIAFTICSNQFHLPKNGCEGLKLVSKMALKEWNTNFRLEYSIRKNRTTFSDVLLLPEIFRWEDTESRAPFFPTGFPRTSERVVLCFRMEYSKPKFVFHSFKAIFDTSLMAATLVSQTNLLGVVLFSYVNALFCPNKLA